MDVQKYFKFSGLATRSEYWGVFFISLAALAVVCMLAAVFTSTGDGGAVMGGLMMLAGGLANIWVLVATTVRRCRDAGINVWFTLLMFVPYVAPIANIVFGCIPTNKTQE